MASPGVDVDLRTAPIDQASTDTRVSRVVLSMTCTDDTAKPTVEQDGHRGHVVHQLEIFMFA